MYTPCILIITRFTRGGDQGLPVEEIQIEAVSLVFSQSF